MIARGFGCSRRSGQSKISIAPPRSRSGWIQRIKDEYKGECLTVLVGWPRVPPPCLTLASRTFPLVSLRGFAKRAALTRATEDLAAIEVLRIGTSRGQGRACLRSTRRRVGGRIGLDGAGLHSRTNR